MSMPAAAQTPAARTVEPSMEEILASIRKIIADDQKALERKLDAQGAAAPVEPLLAPAAPDNDDAGEGMLDLAALARLEPEPVIEPFVAAVPVAPPVIEKPEPVLAQPAPQPVPAEPERLFDLPPLRPAAAGVLPRGLLSDENAGAASASFQSLAHTVFSQNARTLDDLVKEMLKPMLSAWLNENLPSLVERLVRAEIERVARGGQ